MASPATELSVCSLEAIGPSTAPSDEPPVLLHGERRFGLESSQSPSGTLNGSSAKTCGESDGIGDGSGLDCAFRGALVGLDNGFDDVVYGIVDDVIDDVVDDVVVSGSCYV